MLSKSDANRFDVSQIVPDAQSIVLAATQVYLQHLGQWCIGVIICGSTVKGGYIPGCSDIDFYLYLEPSAFTAQGRLPLDICLALHRDLTLVNPYPFQYIQGHALPPLRRPGYADPVPGAYQLVVGSLPVAEAKEEELRSMAQYALENMKPFLLFDSEELLKSGPGRLSRQIRLMCTKVWLALYHMLTIQRENGLEIWTLSKQKAMELLPDDSPAKQALFLFYQAICTYYPAEISVEQALGAIEHGVDFLQSVKLWWENRPA